MKQFLAMFLAGFLFGCVPLTTSMTTSPDVVYAQPAGTGVYINDTELTAAQEAELEAYLGAPVAPGRYYIDENGDATNPGAAQGHSEVFSSGPGGTSSMTSVGDCVMVSTPGVDFAGSGC